MGVNFSTAKQDQLASLLMRKRVFAPQFRR